MPVSRFIILHTALHKSESSDTPLGRQVTAICRYRNQKRPQKNQSPASGTWSSRRICGVTPLQYQMFFTHLSFNQAWIHNVCTFLLTRWTFSFNLVATCWLEDKNLPAAGKTAWQLWRTKVNKLNSCKSIYISKASRADIRLTSKGEGNFYLMEPWQAGQPVGASDGLLDLMAWNHVTNHHFGE